jgi:hypothetical protein
MRSPTVIGFYPKVTGSTSSLLIRHSAVPNLLTENADVPKIPRQYEEVLEFGAICHLKGLERMPKAAAKFWGDYIEKREQLFDYVKKRTQRGHVMTYGGSQVGSRR